MCISILDKEPKKTTKGWKVFNVVPGSEPNVPPSKDALYPLFPHISNLTFRPGRWMKDESDRLLQEEFPMYFRTYQTGFHFFRRKKDAEAYCRGAGETIREIRCRGVTGTGAQLVNINQCLPFMEVACAREIFIGRRLICKKVT
jgi:hypothetical protein